MLMLLGLALLCGSARAQFREITNQTHKQFAVPTDYWVALPEGYEEDTTQRWPMILFLHGGAESNRSGDVSPNIVRQIGPPWEIDKGMKLPFVVISPQARGFGWDPNVLYGLTQEVFKDYRIDEDRVYLTGMSMGGYGTWAMAKEFRYLFAAIAPICGGEDTTGMEVFAHMPIWVFHGDKDDVIPFRFSEQMVEAARKYSDQVKFTPYPGRDHHIYFDIYRENDIYDWFLTHTRYRHTITDPIDPAILKRYEGKYITDKSLEFIMDVKVNDNGKLEVWGTELLPISENQFAQATEYPIYLEFLPNPENGRMELHWRNNSNKGINLLWREN